MGTERAQVMRNEILRAPSNPCKIADAQLVSLG